MEKEPLRRMSFSNPQGYSGWQPSRRLLVIFLSALGLIVFISLAATSPPSLHLDRLSKADGSFLVYNETFGFGAILLISLPERTDRQDGISLLTSLYNISVTKTIDAVHGDDISVKALPFGNAKDTQDAGHMGSWRSHMDAFRYIVDNRIETALVIEDDVDWDVQVKDELHSFAKGLRASQLRKPWTAEELARAPYGLDWDIMHLANAMIDSPPEPYDTLHTTYYDPYRNPAMSSSDPAKGGQWHSWKTIVDRINLPAEHRAIIPSYQCLGLAAIAVSYSGAQRMLYDMSWRGLEEGLDRSVMGMLQRGTIHGWTVAPPLMGTWTVGDSRDSDINTGTSAAHTAAGSKGNMDGSASNIAHSARAAMGEMLERPPYWTLEQFGE